MATFVGQVSVLSLIAIFGAATTAMVGTWLIIYIPPSPLSFISADSSHYIGICALVTKNPEIPVNFLESSQALHLVLLSWNVQYIFTFHSQYFMQLKFLPAGLSKEPHYPSFLDKLEFLHVPYFAIEGTDHNFSALSQYNRSRRLGRQWPSSSRTSSSPSHWPSSTAPACFW